MFDLATRNIFRAVMPLIIAVGSLTANPAEASEPASELVGNWKSGPVSTSDGSGVPQCALQKKLSDGLIVRLSLNLRQKWMLSFAKNGWNSTIGGGQHFYLKVDNGPFYQSAAFVDERHMAHAIISKNGGLFRALLRGRVLKIASENDTTSIELGDAKQIVDYLESCASYQAMAQRGWNNSQHDGFVSTPRS